MNNDRAVSGELIDLAADIVSAYVSNNSLPVGELPSLIAEVHRALNTTQKGVQEPEAEPLQYPP